MPTYITLVLPFYDDHLATPLRPPPLQDQTVSFNGARHTTSTLRGEEVINPAGLDAVTSPVKITIVITSEVLQQPRSRHTTPAPRECRPPGSRHGTTSQTPYPRRAGFRPATSVSSKRPHDTTDDSSSEASSDNESTSSTLSDDCKIPKPQGDPGRPGRGGYNLETALGWKPLAYLKFKKVTYRLIDEHLDTTKCASAQSLVLLKAVRDKAVAAFPDLENYNKAWPVSDMIMMRLKYTSSRARLYRAIEMAAGKGNCPCSCTLPYTLYPDVKLMIYLTEVT